jgi:hypothetical protein
LNRTELLFGVANAHRSVMKALSSLPDASSVDEGHREDQKRGLAALHEARRTLKSLVEELEKL